MLRLSIVSLLWAFSFGLIKNQLAGLDASFVAWVRLLLAWVVFLPLLRLRGLEPRIGMRLALIGAVQFGVMYVAYIRAFASLAAHQVALLTVLTPLYVSLLADRAERRWRPRFFLAALLAVVGAGWIVQAGPLRPAAVSGFLWMQLSNLSFAWGQVEYVRLLRRHPAVRPASVFALIYLGAVVAASFSLLLFGSWPDRVQPLQASVLAYLGLVASGVAFFLWNEGALRVTSGTLAVFNNVKVPLAMLVSMLVFGERAEPVRLMAGSAAVAAGLWLSRPRTATGSGDGG